MDEPADGPPRAPDAAAIRRALAECMTLGDVDDAMGWAAGTARRRRWRDLDDGGLPPADAELGGVPLWFRATITRWRAHGPAPPAATHAAGPEPGSTGAGADSRTGPGPGPEADAGSTAGGGIEAAEAGSAEAGAGTGSGAPTGPDADTRAGPDVADGSTFRHPGGTGDRQAGAEHEDREAGVGSPARTGAPAEATTGEEAADRDARAAAAETEADADTAPHSTEPPGAATDTATAAGTTEPAEDTTARDPLGGVRLATGFALTAGQDVLAYVHGAWHPAVVVSRDRRTVVVDYQLADGPLGARRQRVALERIRLPGTGPGEP
jgi:hypothetical protein